MRQIFVDWDYIMLYYLRQFDWIMIAASCMLTVLGIVTLYSLSHGDPSYTLNLYKQIAFFIVNNKKSNLFI